MWSGPPPTAAGSVHLVDPEALAALCGQLDRPDLAAHTGLALGPASAHAALRIVDRRPLPPSRQISWVTTTAAAATAAEIDASAVDIELDARVAEALGPDGPDVRAIHAASRAGDDDTLSTWLTPARSPTIDLRLLPRAWRARHRPT